MQKNIWIGLVMVSGLLVGSSSAKAATGWESNLLVSAGAVESQLSFGQRADATNLADGRYDVPAMLSGTLQAAFTGGGGSLWRDIRALGREPEEWQLVVASSGGRPVQITWDAEKLPEGFNFELLDADGDQVIAMDSIAMYTLANPAAVLTVRVTAKWQGGMK